MEENLLQRDVKIKFNGLDMQALLVRNPLIHVEDVLIKPNQLNNFEQEVRATVDIQVLGALRKLKKVGLVELVEFD